MAILLGTDQEARASDTLGHALVHVQAGDTENVRMVLRSSTWGPLWLGIKPHSVSQYRLIEP